MVCKKALLISVLSFVAQRSTAQDSTGARQEGWPELNVYYKINQKLRLFGMYSVTKLRTSDFTDGGLGLYVDYFAFGSLRNKFYRQSFDSTRGYYLWLRFGYYYSSTPADSKQPLKEHTFPLDANSRYHLPHDILLTHKNRVDLRIVNGDFQPRYRTRVTLEREVQTGYIFFIPYIYGEYFANLYSGSANRFRVCFGYELKITKHIISETYFLHQFRNGEIIDEGSLPVF